MPSPSVLTLNSDGVSYSPQPLPTQTVTSVSGPSIASQLPKFRIAAAKMKLGQCDLKIALFSDSFGAGNGSSGATTGGMWQGAWTNHLGLSNGYLSMGIFPAIADSRFTLGAGWSGYTGYGWGSSSTYLGNSGTLTFTPGPADRPCDTFDVYYLTNPGCGSFTAQITGGTVSAVTSANAAAGVAVLRVSTPTATFGNAVTITIVSGPVFICGVEALSSVPGRIRIANCGVNGSSASGSASGSWTVNDGLSGLACIKAYAPDLSIIELGANDAERLGATPDAYKSAMLSIIAACQVSGDVILTTPAPFDPAALNVNGVSVTSVMVEYIAAMKDISAANNIPFVNFWDDLFGGVHQPAFMATNGNDPFHGNDYCYVDIGSEMGNVIASVIRV